MALVWDCSQWFFIMEKNMINKSYVFGVGLLVNTIAIFTSISSDVVATEDPHKVRNEINQIAGRIEGNGTENVINDLVSYQKSIRNRLVANKYFSDEGQHINGVMSLYIHGINAHCTCITSVVKINDTADMLSTLILDSEGKGKGKCKVKFGMNYKF